MGNTTTNYKKIYDLTKQLFSNKVPIQIQSPHPYIRWNELVGIWEKLQDNNPLHIALHKMYWGVYPDVADVSTCGELYELIEEELLNKHSSIYKAEKSSAHIAIYYNYLTDSQWADTADGLGYHTDATRCFLGYMMDEKMNGDLLSIHEVSKFKNIICKLIPEAETWSNQQWIDDRNIFSAIKQKYEIDYLQFQDDFDKLYLFLDKKWNCGLNGTYADIFGIENLPFTLAKRIWPRKTVKAIVKKYSDVKKHVEQTVASPYPRKTQITQETLDRSWVMKYNQYSKDNNEKKIAFEIGLGL